MRALTAAAVLAVASVAHANPTKEQCIAADTHAQELRKDGKLHDALAQLESCTNPACPVMIRGDCSARVEEISHSMPTVVFAVKTASGSDVVETRVEMDGHVLRERLDGMPVAVDPGDHTFVLTARGKTETLHILAHEGDKDRRVGMTLAEPPQTRWVAPSPAQRTTGIIVGGSGAVGLVLGAIFGAVTIADHATVTSACPNNGCPSTDAWARVAAANDESRSFGLASTVSFVAGAVLLAAGVALYVTSPRHPRLVVGLTGMTGSF